MAKERGLFTGRSDKDFESDADIKRRLALEGQLPPVIDNIKGPKKFSDYINMAERRSKDAKEFSSRTENTVKIRLPRTSIINVIGDAHIGHPDTDYKRLHQEIEVISNTPDSYVIFNGDMVDGIFWGGASQAENIMTLDEQKGFINTMFKKLKGRILVATSGEHDSKWSSKTGADPYSDFTERTGVPYVRGIAELDIDVGNENYKMVVGHKFRGHSMYNPVHPPNRMSKFHLQDADIYVSNHTHRKGVSQEPVRSFDGSRLVTYGSGGAYKSGDEYSQRQGYVNQKKDEMYGIALKLDGKRKVVDIETDIINANRKWG